MVVPNCIILPVTVLQDIMVTDFTAGYARVGRVFFKTIFSGFLVAEDVRLTSDLMFTVINIPHKSVFQGSAMSYLILLTAWFSSYHVHFSTALVLPHLLIKRYRHGPVVQLFGFVCI